MSQLPNMGSSITYSKVLDEAVFPGSIVITVRGARCARAHATRGSRSRATAVSQAGRSSSGENRVVLVSANDREKTYTNCPLTWVQTPGQPVGDSHPGQPPLGP